jgi:hypothetical protein
VATEYNNSKKIERVLSLNIKLRTDSKQLNSVVKYCKMIWDVSLYTSRGTVTSYSGNFPLESGMIPIYGPFYGKKKNNIINTS